VSRTATFRCVGVASRRRAWGVCAGQVGADGGAAAAAGGAGGAVVDRAQEGLDLVLDGVGELVAAAGDELDAVVRGGGVRGAATHSCHTGRREMNSGIIDSVLSKRGVVAKLAKLPYYS